MGVHIPRWPGRPVEKDDGTPTVHSLWNLQASHAGLEDAFRQFASRVTEVREQERTGVLGPKGVERELRRVTDEFVGRTQGQFGPLVETARQHVAKLRAKLTAPPSRSGESASDAVAREFRNHRAIMRFEGLPRDQRREAVKIAIQKGDREFLAIIHSEPALLDDVSHKMVAHRLMQLSDPVAFDELQQIAGRLDPATGEHDAVSPLTVASYMLDNVAAYAREVTKLEPTAREILVEAGINPDLDQISLSDAQAHDVAIFRAARSFAAENRKSLEVQGGALDAQG